MIFTPEQARSLVCPTRSASKPQSCVAEKCTAFRFWDYRATHGFCGLAGTPRVDCDPSGEWVNKPAPTAPVSEATP
jgi:hypothetical protein